MVVDQQDDAVRLLSKLRQTPAPADYKGDYAYDVARMGVRVYRAMGDVEKAKDYVATSLAANPDDAKLKTLN